MKKNAICFGKGRLHRAFKRLGSPVDFYKPHRHRTDGGGRNVFDQFSFVADFESSKKADHTTNDTCEQPK